MFRRVRRSCCANWTFSHSVKIFIGLFLAVSFLFPTHTSNAAGETGSLSGTLTNSNGDPLAGIPVYAEPYDGGDSFTATTDGNGLFTISDVAIGDYRLRVCPGCEEWASHPYANAYAASGTEITFFYDEAARIAVTDGAAVVLNFQLPAGVSISGTVTDESNHPIANMPIGISNSSGEWVEGTNTNSMGAYTIAGVPNVDGLELVATACPSCSQPVLAYVNGYYSSSGTVRSIDNATILDFSSGNILVNIDLSLEVGNTITGYISHNTSTKIADVDVFAQDVDSHDTLGSARTDADGHYVISNLPDGNYRIMANPQNDNRPYYDQFYDGASQSDQAASVALSGGQTITGIDFSLADALRVIGQVTDQATHLPIANIIVQAESTRDPYDGYSAVTDSDGTYTLYVQPGYYRIAAFPEQDNTGHPTSMYVQEYYPNATHLDDASILAINADTGSISDVNMALTLGGGLDGVVRDQNNSNIAGATVVATLVSDPTISYLSSVSTSTGYYTLTNMLPGEYKLRAMSSGYKAAYTGDGTSWEDAGTTLVEANESRPASTIHLATAGGEDTSGALTTVQMTLTLAEARSYNPTYVQYTHTTTLDDQMFAGLTRIKADTGETIPDLAETWVASDNNQTWIFTLRNELKWSDGSPLTADDVRYGILHNLRLDPENDYSYNLLVIQGAEAYQQGTGSPADVGILVENPKTIAFTLTQPAPQFPSLLAMPQARPLPQRLAQLYWDEWLDPDKIITSGPYALIQYTPETKAVFKKNNSFYNAADVEVDQIVFRQLLPDEAYSEFFSGGLTTANINYGLSQNETLKTFTSGKLETIAEKCTYFLGFNVDALPAELQPADPIKLRQAFIEIVDHTALVSAYNTGLIPTNTLIAPGVFGYSTDPAIYLPNETAAQALSDFQAAYGGSPVPNWHSATLKLYYQSDYSNASSVRNGMQYLANTWNSALGTNFVVEGILGSDYDTKKLNDQMFVWRLGWCSDYSDGYNFLYSINPMKDLFGSWESLQYMTALGAASTIIDPDERAESYHDLETYLLVDQSILMPYGNSVRYVLSRNFVPSFGIGGVDYIADWDVQTTVDYEVGSTASSLNSLPQANQTFAPENESGNVSYSFGGETFSSGSKLSHSVLLTTNLDSIPSGLVTTPYYFDFQAKSASNQAITPAGDYTLTIHYSQVDMDANQIDERSLAFYYWDSAANAWVKESRSQVNAATNTLTTPSRHTGAWIILGVHTGDYDPHKYLYIPLITRN